MGRKEIIEVPHGESIPYTLANGTVIMIHGRPLSGNEVNDFQRASLAMPYQPKKDPDTGEILEEEKQFIGMNCNEVAQLRRVQKAARGDSEEHEKLLDRAYGKPKQYTENVNMNIGLQDALALIREQEDRFEKHGVVDAEIVEQNTVGKPKSRLEDLW